MAKAVGEPVSALLYFQGPMAKSSKIRTQAVAYLRTSSAANVGEDKDSDKRQRAAIDAYAKRAGFDVVAEFYDAAVSGADAIDARPGFSAMLRQIASNGARTIIVETANRFARDLVVQETGYRMLLDKGITMIAADSPSAFLDDGPTTTFVRQVLGAVAELDKAMTVAKLRGARERVRRRDGKCEGRKSRVERARGAGGEAAAKMIIEAIATAKRLRRASPKTGERRSFRQIAGELQSLGHLNERGQPYNAASIKAMVDGPMPEGG
jgi:DNA invertase Pin-like site-specific DNA recombinase